ncbi:monocyte chemotactic protein 1B-like isoform X1 [Anguilla anguilla]|uniref:monocyte chemotactic protein 1B-like isoform X1 n=1 Tax=Anguilla anguilla TaxID=7936 RepID=UPI0015AEA09E|nr:monocyte chemotactic protein 1B-like isoform X1 [Anguilla anguilla]
MRLSVITATGLLLLCASAWMPRVTATDPTNCCLKVSKTRLRLKNIVDYAEQPAGLCPVKAIVFKTRRGMWVCANPEKDWVKMAVEKVAERKKAKGKGKSKKRGQGKKDRRGQSPAPKVTSLQN